MNTSKFFFIAACVFGFVMVLCALSVMAIYPETDLSQFRVAAEYQVAIAKHWIGQYGPWR